MLKTMGGFAGIGLVFILSFGASGVSRANDANSSTQPIADDPPQVRSVPELEMRGIALPASWKADLLKKSDTHFDAEWKAPSEQTVFGAVCIRVPPLMGGDGLAKSVKNNYVKRQPEGRMTREWRDSSQRNWFEVDATGTHSKGFVVTHGHHAWLVYYRYSTDGRSPRDEIAVADHAINLVAPIED